MIASSPRGITLQAICPAQFLQLYDGGISGGSRIPDEELWRNGYPSSNGSSAHSPSQGISRLLVLAYICAISIPPLGLGLGIAVAMRLGKTRHAIAIIVLSLAAAAVWILMLTSGSLSATSTDY